MQNIIKSSRFFSVVCLATLFVVALSAQRTYAFMDDFDSGELGAEWVKSPTGEDASWIVADGALMFTGAGGASLMMTGEAGWSDYTVECDIMLDSADNYPGGIRTYIDPDNNGAHYAVWLYPGDTTIKLFIGTDWDINPGLVELGVFEGLTADIGSFFHIKVVHDGDHIEVWYGEDKASAEKVIEVDDATFGSGLFGFDGYNQPIHYDNLAISGPGIPDSETAAVDSRGKLAVTWSELKTQ